MKYLLPLLLLIPSFCSADEWTKSDTGREVVYLILHVADWGQTRNGVHRESEGYWEINPILGKHPSIKRVDTHFTVTAIAHVAIAYALPRKWREAFQYTTAGIEAVFVIDNNSIGLRVDF